MSDLKINSIDIKGISDCLLRRSARAKRMRIELRPDRSLLIVIPDGTREDQWLAFLLSKKQWIARNLQRSAQQQDPKNTTTGFPSQLELVCTGQKYQTCRVTGAQNRAILVDSKLDLVCDQYSEMLAYQVLRRWLIKQARGEFTARLQRISIATGLKWNRLSIRGQKTRWGSCSAKGNISLNFKLLFLPANLVDHVLLHELVHTREMNHSHRFWALMMKFDPQCDNHRSELRNAGRRLPDWLVNL